MTAIVGVQQESLLAVEDGLKAACPDPESDG